MKTLLKKIFASLVLTTSTASIIACNTPDKQVNPQDVVNLALGTIVNDKNNLRITSDLKLDPSFNLASLKDKSFSGFDQKVQDAIDTYFTNKVKNSITQYQVDVKISDAKVEPPTANTKVKTTDDVNPKFAIPVSAKVSGFLDVQATVTYKGISNAGNFSLAVNNDNSSNFDKMTDISNFIGSQITSKALSINVSNLPDINETPQSQLNSFQPDLRTTILEMVHYSELSLAFKPKPPEPPTPQVKLEEQKDSLFKMVAPDLDPTDNSTRFNGGISNFQIVFSAIGDWDKSVTLDVTGEHPIVIHQDFNNAVTQITNLFSDYIYHINTLPPENISYSSYIATAAGQAVAKAMNDAFFARISGIYAKDVMKETWTASLIGVANGDTEKFVPSADDPQNSGSFTLNFTFKFTKEQMQALVPNSTSVFDITTSNSYKLNLVAPNSVKNS